MLAAAQHRLSVAGAHDASERTSHCSWHRIILWLRVPSLVQTYLHNGLTYVSQLLHNVRVTGLPYGQTIYYK